MQADLGLSRLMLTANGQTTAFRANDSGQMARLANSYASNKLGLAPARQPGAYLPVYESTARMVEEAVYETRDVTQTTGVFEERTVIEMRDVIETRPVYEQREILETKVTGGRRLTRYDSISEAGIDRGADFAVTVGDGETAMVTFESSSKISVTVGGSTEEFTFNSGNGEWRAGLRDALNSIDGLFASYSNGRLVLLTDDAQALTIEDVPNGRWDWSDNPIDRLGLNEGVTEAAIIGYEQVQTGTEEIVTGQEEVVSTVLVKVGEQDVVTGSETVMTGTVSRLDGYDQTLVGLVKPETYGAGVLGLLAEGSSGLPADYVELLFGAVSNEQDAPNNRGFDAEIRDAYAETSGTDRFEEELDPLTATGFGEGAEDAGGKSATL